MTVDDALKGLVGVLLTGLSTTVGWLVSKVLGTREATLVQEQRILRLEAEIKAVKDSQLTRECVQEVIDQALDKRDKQAAERREEWDKRLTLQIKDTVREALDRKPK